MQNNYDYIIDDNEDSYGCYDFTDCCRQLLEEIKLNETLNLEQRIEIINDFSNKYRPGEDYGGGYPCENTDCYRDFTSEYFIEIKGKKGGFTGLYKRCKYEIKEVSVFYCPLCIEDLDIDSLFPFLETFE